MVRGAILHGAIAGALQNGKPRVLREVRIRCRQAAQVKLGPSVGLDQAHVLAGGAQANRVVNVLIILSIQGQSYVPSCLKITTLTTFVELPPAAQHVTIRSTDSSHAAQPNEFRLEIAL